MRPKRLVILGIIVVVAVGGALAVVALSPSSPFSTSGGIQSRTFRVYREPSVGAFSMLIPADWTASTNLIPHYATFNPQVYTQLADPTGAKSIIFQEYAIPDFSDPSVDAFGRPEGSWLIEGYNLLYRYRSASEYAQSFMILELQRTYENVQLVGVYPVSDPWRLELAPGASIADALFTATRGGIVYEIGTTIYTWYFGGGLVWNATYYIFAAPQGRLDELMQDYALMVPTFRWDPNFLLSRIRQAGAVSAQTTKTFAELRVIYGQAYANAAESSSRIGQSWSDAILGTIDVTNPRTGESLTVSNNFRFWWTDGLGNLIATNREGSPDPLRDLTLLESVSR